MNNEKVCGNCVNGQWSSQVPNKIYCTVTESDVGIKSCCLRFERYRVRKVKKFIKKK